MSASSSSPRLIAIDGGDSLPVFAHALGGPLCTGTRFCLEGCSGCHAAIAVAGLAQPTRLVRIHTELDRIVVTVRYLADTLGAGRVAADLRYVEDDRVLRLELCGDERLLPDQRWWSLARWEDACARGRIAPPASKAVRRRIGAGAWPPRHAG
jgi:hypothetical protein